MACSPPPTWALPPGASTFKARSWSLTWTADSPSACMRAGSSSTRISRLTPPLRVTCATPGTASSRLVTVLSMNQLSCSGVRPVVVTA